MQYRTQYWHLRPPHIWNVKSFIKGFNSWQLFCCLHKKALHVVLMQMILWALECKYLKSYLRVGGCTGRGVGGCSGKFYPASPLFNNIQTLLCGQQVTLFSEEFGIFCGFVQTDAHKRSLVTIKKFQIQITNDSLLNQLFTSDQSAVATLRFESTPLKCPQGWNRKFTNIMSEHEQVSTVEPPGVYAPLMWPFLYVYKVNIGK